MTRRNGAHAGPAPITFRVEVAGKPAYADAAGQAVLAQLPTMGVAGAAEVRVCPIYEITGPFNAGHVESAARELLSDPITQEYRIGDGSLGPAFLLGPHWRVEVWLKPGVSDPAESSICKAVKDIGLPAPSRVRCGTVYKIAGRCQRPQIDRIVRKLLANPVIHDFTVTAP